MKTGFLVVLIVFFCIIAILTVAFVLTTMNRSQRVPIQSELLKNMEMTTHRLVDNERRIVMSCNFTGFFDTENFKMFSASPSSDFLPVNISVGKKYEILYATINEFGEIGILKKKDKTYFLSVYDKSANVKAFVELVQEALQIFWCGNDDIVVVYPKMISKYKKNCQTCQSFQLDYEIQEHGKYISSTNETLVVGFRDALNNKGCVTVWKENQKEQIKNTSNKFFFGTNVFCDADIIVVSYGDNCSKIEIYDSNSLVHLQTTGVVRGVDKHLFLKTGLEMVSCGAFFAVSSPGHDENDNCSFVTIFKKTNNKGIVWQHQLSREYGMFGFEMHMKLQNDKIVLSVVDKNNTICQYQWTA